MDSNVLIVFFGPIILLAVFIGFLSALPTYLIAKSRRLDAAKWLIVGIFIPYISIALALIWPTNYQSHSQ
ncbi:MULTISPECIES: hypothetical protein [Gammaproteobacteria]|uniref:hypothetical protein n=1 Tax=Gammaproteobacteria TaxID=1236 RepID=UPI000DD02493|nr:MULTISPECIES: hypothetical protein [Gammaproteobacteria]RTE86919.1 hypothetical protein DQX04_00575 [Aliidiomarina sp. B3213]TCZ93291.1 hypothetical protein EYQ95_04725 [Lysobacter sp. N42]